MPDRLALCIAGCGSYARLVLENLGDAAQELDLFFASRDEAKARLYCREFGGVGYFGGYEAAASDPRVEAIYFFTPHDRHMDDALMAIGHGKHVLMEKPIARTLEEARQMEEAAQRAGVTLMVAENYRFVPAVQRAKELIDEGRLGDLRLVHIQAEGYRAPQGWRTRLEACGGGVFIDGGIHYVDVMVNLGGYPQSLFAVRPPQVFTQVEGEDGIVLAARLPGGGAGVISFSRATPVPDVQRQRVSITGTRGFLSFDPYGDALILETPQGSEALPLPHHYRGVPWLLREFKEALRQGREPLMSAREAMRDLAVVLGAYRAAEEGMEVALSEP